MPLACADEGTGTLEEVVDPWVEVVVQKMEEACFGTSSNIASGQVSDLSSVTSMEEKKIENEDIVPTPVLAIEKPTATSDGVRTVRNLLKISSTDTMPTVEDSSLPSLGASLSSCKLINEEEIIK